MSQIVGLPNNSYKPITNTAWISARLCKLQKKCTRLTTASDQVYHLLAHGRWFSLGTLPSSTTKTGCHDIAEILLKVALNTKNKKIKSYLQSCLTWGYKSKAMGACFCQHMYIETNYFFKCKICIVDKTKYPIKLEIYYHVQNVHVFI